ncbi:MAG: alanine--glyoxylate aminotransferase family protein [Actinomycetota bacterium]
MPGLLPDVDPDGLLEYSVVYTDRAVNHMSVAFQQVMGNISSTLKRVYNAEAVVIVPGSGTYGMEAVARQFASGEHALVVRNGFFSYRWSQIFEMGSIPRSHTVLTAGPLGDETNAPFAPPPIDRVTATIAEERPAVVCAPHVETSAGMLLPDEYLRALADATHAAGGLFVLDCIASGTLWVDMEATGVDVLCSAPQKGWSGPPCAGLVMLSSRAVERLGQTTSSSFACDLRKWHDIMAAYESGGHAYHATMPTDSLRVFRDVMAETEAFGFSESKTALTRLGSRVRELLVDRGFASVAAEGFQSPGVVVSYTDDPAVKSGKRFAEVGLQVAGGVPLMVGEPDDFSTFRIGLFGLDKIADIDRTVDTFRVALDNL